MELLRGYGELSKILPNGPVLEHVTSHIAGIRDMPVSKGAKYAS